MKWRLYRLPGSRRMWLIDSGPGTEILTCTGIQGLFYAREFSDDNAQPRAWLELVASNLYIDSESGVAYFHQGTGDVIVREGRFQEVAKTESET
jgi:hypothetical protein